MFTTRRLPNERFILPALAAAYLLAADTLSRVLNRISRLPLRLGVIVAVLSICLAELCTTVVTFA